VTDRPTPGFVVFHHEGGGLWRLVGEAPRKPGLTARRARAQAVQDATGGTAKPGETYAAVLRSEWRVSLDL
jgi:hypothetical protein